MKRRVFGLSLLLHNHPFIKCFRQTRRISYNRALFVTSNRDNSASEKVPLTPLGKILKQNIYARGAISIAEFMKECLQHPHYGYYMQKQMLGKRGDFITAPEISQTFGELIGIWFLSLMERMSCSPKPFRLIELGPGNGTLMNDMLRVFSRFPQFYSCLSVHLVETSPVLCKLQEERLKQHKQNGIVLSWHKNLDEIPYDGSVFIIAQEFFDALPVHQFYWQNNGWKEKLIDVDTGDNEPFHFCFVLSRTSTVYSRVFLDTLGYDKDRNGQYHANILSNGLELSPQSLSIVQQVTRRLTLSPGAFLMVDYGSHHPTSDTLRAIRSHEFVPLFKEPGLVDLSADVNFVSLRQAVEQTPLPNNSQNSKEPLCLGPITQRHFLLSLGIEYRILQLILSCKTDKEAVVIHEGYKRLVSTDNGMGHLYKCLALVSQDLRIPPGFE
eukprot:jgi/Galph1/2016/GphlegSOOS_G667.1